MHCRSYYKRGALAFCNRYLSFVLKMLNGVSNCMRNEDISLSENADAASSDVEMIDEEEPDEQAGHLLHTLLLVKSGKKRFDLWTHAFVPMPTLMDLDPFEEDDGKGTLRMSFTLQ